MRNWRQLDVEPVDPDHGDPEDQQQKAVNWLLPGVSSVLETTIAYEQVAVDLTGWIARHEPDPYLKQSYEFGVPEGFDHLHRYANLYEVIEHHKAESIVEGLIEVVPGRPTKLQGDRPDPLTTRLPARYWPQAQSRASGRHSVGPLTLDPSGANEWWKVNACGAEAWSWRCSSLETPSCQVGITPSETHQNT